MSVRAEGTNARFRNSDKKGIEKIKKRVNELIQDGMPREQAETQAHQEARDNNTMHWQK